MMDAGDLIALLDRIERAGLTIWLDGGWAVDALLGTTTRVHDDLDLVVTSDEVGALRRLLEADGYRDVPRPDTRPENFVLGDEAGRLVDFHVVSFDADGNGVYGPPAAGVFYPAYAFGQTGSVNGRKVRCISARYLVESHQGYQPRDKDIADMQKLCTRFGLPLPLGYPAPTGSGT